MSGVNLSPAEAQELYVLLKSRESSVRPPLTDLLRRIEKDLFDRMTIEEIELLLARSADR